MTADRVTVDEPAETGGAPSCPCGDDMWYLAFGYDSWVCRTNPRHWFRPASGRWSTGARTTGKADPTG